MESLHAPDHSTTALIACNVTFGGLPAISHRNLMSAFHARSHPILLFSAPSVSLSSNDVLINRWSRRSADREGVRGIVGRTHSTRRDWTHLCLPSCPPVLLGSASTLWHVSYASLLCSCSLLYIALLSTISASPTLHILSHSAQDMMITRTNR